MAMVISDRDGMACGGSRLLRHLSGGLFNALISLPVRLNKGPQLNPIGVAHTKVKQRQVGRSVGNRHQSRANWKPCVPAYETTLYTSPKTWRQASECEQRQFAAI